jgi:hypothetical protein
MPRHMSHVTHIIWRLGLWALSSEPEPGPWAICYLLYAGAMVATAGGWWWWWLRWWYCQ